MRKEEGRKEEGKGTQKDPEDEERFFASLRMTTMEAGDEKK